MSNPEEIKTTIEFYGENKFVILPLDYNDFIQRISSMLQIEKEKIANFQFSYQNDSDLKIYFIKNAEDYALFLNTCKEKKTNILNIKSNEMFDDKEDNEEKDNKIKIYNKIETKEIHANENQKKNFFGEKKVNEDNKNNVNQIIINNKDSGNILNKIDDNLEAMEFSYLDESNIVNNKNNIINHKKENMNNNKINNKMNESSAMKNFNINCDNCKQKKSSDIVYYCSDCKIFFCEACEDNIGKIHKHCYYKMRNKKQYEGLKNSINTFGNKFQNLNNNMNKSIINNGINIENSVNKIISEGSKLFGNIGNSLKNFFNQNENQENQNQNNNIESNELINPYTIKNNNIQRKNIGNITEEKQLKLLVAQAKNTYNLSQFSDKDIETALIHHKGNIEEAVSMLFSNNDL
jgi:hypothetical protein